MEVQVVSIANHVFNELEHDIEYKPHGVTPTDGVTTALENVLHASRLMNSLVPRLLDERAASISDAETLIPSDGELRFTLEKLTMRPLSGDFMRLFRLLNASFSPLTPAAVRELGGGPTAVLEAGRALAAKEGIACAEDVTAYAIGLYSDLGDAFSAVASSWRGPTTELKRAILHLKGKEPQ